MTADVTEGIGNNVGGCVNNTYEVTTSKSVVDWDDRYRVGSASVEGTSVGAILEKTPERTLTLSHEGNDVTFSAGALTSDKLRGEKISGTWTLRLSSCAAPPPALIVKVEADCTQ
jgi:hypothetical protein